MFERLAGSWELTKASAKVLRADKELILFPIVAAISTLLVTVSFAIPLFSSGALTYLGAGTAGSQAAAVLVAFLFYLMQYTVIFFANSALVGAALIRLRGGDPTVRDGFAIAMKHLPAIFGYALISATVGMLLRWISERVGFLGSLVVWLVGAGWNIATYLVVPVLVVEELGPLDAIKRSTQLLQQTFGEQIVGNLGIGLMFTWMTFFAFIIAIGAMGFAAAIGQPLLIAPALVIMVFVFIFLGLLRATLSGIYAAAIYRYAADGTIDGYFGEEMVKGAFRLKGK